jgi:hypothetical protein
MSRLWGIVGHKRSRASIDTRRHRRVVNRLIKLYPDLWPAVVVHGQERWQDMPSDQFDWAIEQSLKRLEQRNGRR